MSLPYTPNSSREDIRLLQIKLNQAYELTVSQQGVWDAGTTTAVKNQLLKFTNSTDPDVLAGKEVNAAMWNGLEKDWTLDFLPATSGGGVTEARVKQLINASKNVSA